MRKLTFLVLAMFFVVLVGAVFVNAGDTEKVNINTASAEQLVALKGVGESYAVKIVEFREQNGPFKTPDDLMKVPGIGPKVFESNKDMIVTEE
jgi:competence protein ComEA